MCTNKCDNNLRKEGEREGRKTGKIERGKGGEGGKKDRKDREGEGEGGGEREGRTGKIERGKEREGGEGGVLFSCLLILRQGLELAM